MMGKIFRLLTFNLLPLSIVFIVSGCFGDAQDTIGMFDTRTERLLQVGNHKLFMTMNEVEDPTFTVVFQSGAGSTSQDWTKVMSMLPAQVKGIAYDRAGMGKSEKGPLPQTMAQTVLELHELLKAAKVRGPIILVGQSLGGLMVRLYSEKYPKDVIGVVLVDPTHENIVLGNMRYGGWVRLREKAKGKAVPKPQLINTVSPGYDSTADYLAEELQLCYLSTLKNPQQLGDRPVVILGAGIRPQPPGTPEEQWRKIRTERDQQIAGLSSLSSNSKFILDSNSRHAIQSDNPAIVVQAVDMVINSIQSGRKL